MVVTTEEPEKEDKVCFFPIFDLVSKETKRKQFFIHFL